MNTEQPKWAKLRPEDIRTLGIKTYEGEVVLIDYGRNPIDVDSFYFNAQVFFSDSDIKSMPWFDAWLFIDKPELSK